MTQALFSHRKHWAARFGTAPFLPMSRAEMDAYRRRLAPVAADGRFELYKSTAEHEGEEGRAQHGFPSPAELAG